MTHVVLFHHVLGLTPGVVRLAESIRAAGHSVTTPDLLDGKTFADIPEGLAHVGQLGDDELRRRAEQACATLPGEVVYAGLSLGVVPAQYLLQTKPGASGALLLHSFIAPQQLPGTWPADCPIEIYAMDRDPFFVGDGDLNAARVWQATHLNLHIHLYPGDGHLFMEPGLPDHDPGQARALTRDLVAALGEMG